MTIDIEPKSMSLQKWIFFRTGYMPPNPPYTPSQASSNNSSCPNGYSLYVLAGSPVCAPDNLKPFSPSKLSGVHLIQPSAPSNSFEAFGLYWPYKPIVATLNDWIYTVKYYTPSNNPYYSVCNMNKPSNLPQSVWNIYWSALEWDYNNANLCSNYKPPKATIYGGITNPGNTTSTSNIPSKPNNITPVLQFIQSLISRLFK